MKAVAVAAVAIVAVLIVGVLTLTHNPTHSTQVELTSFNTTGLSAGSSIGFVDVWFVLNLNNTGAGDVKDLTVTFSTNTTNESNQQLTYTNSTVPYDHIAEFEIGEPCSLGELKAGETKDFKFYWVVNPDFDSPPLTATLKSNEVPLDQKPITFPAIPKVKITNFTYLGIWHGTTLGGLLDLFSLNYTNLGMTNVENLTVTLTTSKTNEKNTSPQHATPTPIPGYNPYYLLDETINGEAYPLEDLKANETKLSRDHI
jgi:hypothetical protein